LEEFAKMVDRLREKDAVKDMESMFDDIKEEGTQTKLMGTDKGKKTAAKAVCDKVVADWVYNTMQSFMQRDRRLQLHRNDPRHCCSIVIGGGGGKGGRSSLFNSDRGGGGGESKSR
jgi:hypothetical protein